MKIRKIIIYTISLYSALSFNIFAQSEDSTYIESYKQNIWIMGFTSMNSVQIDKEYKPNSPLNLGFGLAIKNTVINAAFKLPIITRNEDKYGKTENTDVLLHRYSKHYLFDLFYQRYKGLYSEQNNIKLFPDRLIQQIGFEGTYIFNGNEFSTKAAFRHKERQLKSASSFIIGGSLTHHKPLIT